MASSSRNVPPHPDYESDGLGDDVSPSNKHGAATPPENQTVRPTITAVRIPADGTLPYLINLELIKATPEYHFELHDCTLLHRSHADDIQGVHCHSSDFFDPVDDDSQIDVHRDYDMVVHSQRKTAWPMENLEYRPLSSAHSRGNDIGAFLHVPLAERTENPHLTFTHASLRLQPNVVEPFWRCEEAWKHRAFQRLYAFPREDAGLEMMTGEYHIMFTHFVGKGLRPNKWARSRVWGDAFVLRMAGGKDGEGDWYYEDMPEEILHCSLGNQCLEALRSVKPINWKTLVGERGNGPPGVISFGTGLRGRVARVYGVRRSDCFTD